MNDQEAVKAATEDVGREFDAFWAEWQRKNPEMMTLKLDGDGFKKIALIWFYKGVQVGGIAAYKLDRL